MERKKALNFNKLTRLPSRNKNLQKAFKRVLTSGYLILGKEVANFEKEFASFLNAKYCIGVGNGQEALQISLMVLGIGKGNEVITTPISAVATTLSILAVGAKPIFVDTDEFGQINIDLIQRAVTSKTRAILPVHLYGNPLNMDKLNLICKQFKLNLVEDACQAHGSSYKGKKLGTFGNLGCFSFFPTKNLGAFGDGGAIVTNNAKLAEFCRQVRNYGQKKQYHHIRYGLNSRLDELHAALLSEELKNLESDNIKRRQLAKRYTKNLNYIPEFNPESNYHLFVIKHKQRNKLQKYLADFGIQTLIHYPRTIPDQPFLKREYGGVSIPTARNFVKQILSLPCHPQMSLKDVDYVSGKIRGFMQTTAKDYSRV